MLTSTSLYHDEGASHWHTHNNVIWADEETLTEFSYVSLQSGEGPCARIFVENNYVINVKEDYLTCGAGRVDPCRNLREKNSVMLYKGDCPEGFAPVEGSYHESRVNELICGAGVPGRKNGKPLNLKGYRYKVVGEKPGFNFTAKCDELSDRALQQFDFPLRWYKFNYGEVRRLGEKYAEDYSDYEIALFAEGRARSVKTLFSSIDTTVGLSEFGLYSGMGKFERTMRFARRVGCENIRIYGGLVAPGDDPAVYYSQALNAIREYVKLAEEKGFYLWLTLKNGTAVDNADTALRILKDVDSEMLRLAFNPAEAYRAGLDVMAEYEKLRPYLVCMEVTDLDEKGMSVPVGVGVLPYEALLKNLIDTGYGGFVCLSPAFGLLGGRSSILANGKTLNLAGPNRYRMNASYLALKDVMEKIGHPIP
jgi:sugar phosphate isomerase/epimerase